MCELYDLEPCTVWSETVHRARKQYECVGCGAAILPGDSYLRHFDVHDGYANSERACAACWWDLEDFGQHHGQRMAPSNLEEMLSDCYGEESRGYWTESDKHWRLVHAALLKRYRKSPAFARHRAARTAGLGKGATNA